MTTMKNISVKFLREPRKVALAFAVTLVVLTVCVENTLAAKRPASPTPSSQSKRQKLMDPAFENAGQKAGLEIWRVEDFKPVPYPKKDYGKFYTGDSYIILFTKIKNNVKTWDIHFWLGSETTQDEAGAAAILAVHLDDHLGGVPVQYREVQDHESQLFLSHFPSGVRYAPGGIQSGFTHVDRNAHEKRLFQVKGSKNIRVKQVTPTIASMNTGDCFILDIGSMIYVYVGEKSRRTERMKAIAAANQIRDQDHGGKPRVEIIDNYGSEKDYEEFFEKLGGGHRSEVPDENVGGDDAEFDKSSNAITLYRVSDASGSLQITPINQKPLESSSLDPNDCFILDTADANIFVWVGKKCTAKEKTEAMKKAEAFLTEKKYPKWTQIQRVVQGAEPVAFTQCFKTWRGTGETHDRLVRSASSDKWEPRLFHAQIRRRGGPFKTEQVIDFKQQDLNEDDVMLLDLGIEIFVWVGDGASEEEKQKSKQLAVDYLNKLGDANVPIKIINQGQEPQDFKQSFPSWNPKMWQNLP